MRFDRTSLTPVAVGSLVALALLTGGALIGGNLWPRVVKVEQRVVAPAMNAAGFTPAIENLGDMIGRSCPAIVAIRQDGQGPDSAAQAPSTGRMRPANPPAAAAPRTASGFLASSDGYIVTAADNLSEAGDIHVLLNDGRVLDATRVGSDPISGIAVLKIDGSGLAFLKFSNANFPRVGDWGAAISSPNGSGCAAALGMVGTDSLAEQAALRTYVRIRPTLDQSLAGAPLLNLNGEIIGVIGLGGPAEDPDRPSSILAVGTASRIVSGLMRNGKPTENRFGIIADDLPPALATRLGIDGQRGAVVSLVEADSPADKGGLRAGDLILGVSGSPVSGASELARALDTSAATLSLDVVRASKRLTITLAP
ncbi:hypothetical protein GCM10009087_26790 [Sphingomonas oligophenolica]|uniref:Trypsin-like peptidase domain-containing protein n=1 Tax=Sphingomonas oligophenolica TaxID=301154 RepID=A0ABU9YC72_9SPHN